MNQAWMFFEQEQRFEGDLLNDRSHGGKSGDAADNGLETVWRCEQLVSVNDQSGNNSIQIK